MRSYHQDGILGHCVCMCVRVNNLCNLQNMQHMIILLQIADLTVHVKVNSIYLFCSHPLK